MKIKQLNELSYVERLELYNNNMEIRDYIAKQILDQIFMGDDVVEKMMRYYHDTFCEKEGVVNLDTYELYLKIK